jgi:hypothetical protein
MAQYTPGPAQRAGRVIRTFELQVELENSTPAASALTPMRVQADSSPVRSHLAVSRADSLLTGYTRMQSAPLPRTTEGAALEQAPEPILWDPIFPAPRPSPRTRIVCVSGQSPKEENDRTSETEYLERVITLLELSMERLVGSSRELQGWYDALQKKNNMLELEHVELKKKYHQDFANKDSEIEIALQKKNNMLELEHVELKKIYLQDIANKDSEIEIALQKKNNMLELEHVELKKIYLQDIANKDSEIQKLQEEILRLSSVKFQLKDR